MRVRVLGSAAGGGFPQWNCGCANCAGVRSGAIRAHSRTQESVAVSADGESWLLLNASPEVRAQIESYSPLHPRSDRHSPVAAVALTSGDLDHCLGLLCLRESQPLSIHATSRVRRGFTENNSLYATLERFDEQARWRDLELGQTAPLTRGDGSSIGLRLTPVALPGQPPLHLRTRFQPSPEDNVGLLVEDTLEGGCLAYFPGSAGIGTAVLEAAAGADCLFFDGTFWTRGELVDAGLSERDALAMGHVPQSGADGSLVALAGLAMPRYLIHINNTNPILDEDSDARRELAAAGVGVAYDGLELSVKSGRNVTVVSGAEG